MIKRLTPSRSLDKPKGRAENKPSQHRSRKGAKPQRVPGFVPLRLCVILQRGVRGMIFIFASPRTFAYCTLACPLRHGPSTSSGETSGEQLRTNGSFRQAKVLTSTHSAVDKKQDQEVWQGFRPCRTSSIVGGIALARAKCRANGVRKDAGRCHSGSGTAAARAVAILTRPRADRS